MVAYLHWGRIKRIIVISLLKQSLFPVTLRQTIP